ncbi:trehalose 6-phosphate synthase/phosphatase [Enteropsectra breve]|nr:trehalose 6-phosphate synthase/phosphatase [Enteropsectra breve]
MLQKNMIGFYLHLIGCSMYLKKPGFKSMKIVYCAPTVNLDDIKTAPSQHTSSKIGRFHKRAAPRVQKEFLPISNITYIPVAGNTRLAAMWNNFMGKETFRYNFEDLDSRAVYQEYLKYNQLMANKINKITTKSDLLIINDASLFLLPDLVHCNVAIRNIRFDRSFIERIPFHEKIIDCLLLADRFFISPHSLSSFESHVNSAFRLTANSHSQDFSYGKSFFIKNPVDKESIYKTLLYIYRYATQGKVEVSNEKILGISDPSSVCGSGCSFKCGSVCGSTTTNSLNMTDIKSGDYDQLSRINKNLCFALNNVTIKERESSNNSCISENSFLSTKSCNKIIDYINNQRVMRSATTILTNVNLLHLEGYISKNPSTAIRYIRTSSDEEQERMVEYLRKCYGCTIDPVDNLESRYIAIEMLFSDVFIGDRYTELAKLLRKPCFHDCINPEHMAHAIEELLLTSNDDANSAANSAEKVYGEDKYLENFLDKCGYKIKINKNVDFDEKISEIIGEVEKWVCAARKEDTNTNTIKISKLAIIKNENEDVANRNTNGNSNIGIFINNTVPLYEKVENDEKSYYVKRDSLYSIDVLFNKSLEKISDNENNNINNNNINNNINNKINNNINNNINNSEHDDMLILKNKQTIILEKDDSLFKNCGCYEMNYFVENDVEVDSVMNNGINSRRGRKVDLVKIKKRWEKSNKIAVLDYDGTLTEVVNDPEAAKPSEDVIMLIRQLNKKARIIICTGRGTETVDEWFPEDIEVFAEHGAEHRIDGRWRRGVSVKKAGDASDSDIKCDIKNMMKCCSEIFDYFHIKTPGSVIEKKKHGMAFHYRHAKHFDISKLYGLLKRVAGDSVILGKFVIEVRSGSKGAVVEEMQPALVAGDDKTDEEMFEKSNGITIKIGSEETKAEYEIGSSADFITLLAEIVL